MSSSVTNLETGIIYVYILLVLNETRAGRFWSETEIYAGANTSLVFSTKVSVFATEEKRSITKTLFSHRVITKLGAIVVRTAVCTLLLYICTFNRDEHKTYIIVI